MAFWRVWSSLLEWMFAMGNGVSVWCKCSLLPNLNKIEAGQLTYNPIGLFGLLPSQGLCPRSRFLSIGTYWHFGLDNSFLWGAVLFIEACLAASLVFTHWTPVASPPPGHDDQTCLQTLPNVLCGTKLTLVDTDRCICSLCLAHASPKDPYFYLLTSFKSLRSSYPSRLLRPPYLIMQTAHLLDPSYPLPFSTF